MPTTTDSLTHLVWLAHRDLALSRCAAEAGHADRAMNFLLSSLSWDQAAEGLASEREVVL